jgi:hypothetical protein
LIDDRTDASDNLFDALVSGSPVNNVPEWRESRNNVAGSIPHYVQLLNAKTEEFVRADENEKLRMTLSWLQTAESQTYYLAERFSDDPLSIDTRHISAWRSAFELFLAEHYPSIL